MDLVKRVQTAVLDGIEARNKEIGIFSPFPPYQEVEYPWDLFWKAYRKADYWSLFKSMPSWKSRPNYNYVRQVVDNNTTLMTDNRPMMVPYAFEGKIEDYYLAEALKTVALRWWSDQTGDMKTMGGVKFSSLFGLGWWRLDRTKKNGQVWSVISPENVVVSPDTTYESFLIKEPNYLVYIYETPFGELKRNFPRQRTDDEGNPIRGRNIDWDGFDIRWTAETGRNSNFMGQMFSGTRPEPTKMVKVYELWTQDSQIVEWAEPLDSENPDGEQKKLRALKYPRGRVITVAGGQVLDDRENPYEHSQYPFIPVFGYINPGQFYPTGDVQDVLPLVIMRNRFMQLIFDGTVKAGGTLMLLGKALNLKPKDIENAPYQVIECNDPHAINVISKGEPPRHVYNVMDRLDRDADNMARYHEISKGAQSEGNPMTAEEARIVAESDRTAIRLKSRQLTWSLNRLMNQWGMNLAQYESEREFAVEVATKGDAPVPGMEAETTIEKTFTPKELFKKDKIKDGLKYGVRFVEYTSLPSAMQEDKQLAMVLYDKGLYDEEDLFLALNIPDARAKATKAKQRIAGAKAEEAPANTPAGPPPPEMMGMPTGMPPGMPEMPPEMPEGPPAMEGGEAPPLPPELMAMAEELMAQGLSPQEAVMQIMAQMQG